MSEQSTPQHWFWRALGEQARESLTDEQRAAIDKALTPKASIASDIRLSFGRYYMVIRWGREKRSWSRLKDERKAHPVMTLANLPILVTLWTLFFLGVYTVLGLSMRGIIALIA